MSKKERRTYIRISTVLPVEFFLADQKGNKLTPWLQGFTCDIGRGGICLTVNDLWWGFWDKFKNQKNKIFLRIKLPFKKEPLFCQAAIKWLDSQELKKFCQYKIGLEFENFEKKKQKIIFNFALFKKVTPIAAISLITVSLLISGVLFTTKYRLERENRQLIAVYGDILGRNSYLARALQESREAEAFFSGLKDKLTEEIRQLETVIDKSRQRYQDLSQIREKDSKQLVEMAALEDKLTEFNRELKQLRRENEFLKTTIAAKEKTAAVIEKEAQELQVEKQQVSEKVISGMYEWIKNRQDLRRGLVLSYEGDSAMEKVCFTYDQSLSIFVFLIFNDLYRAEKILDFYLDKVRQGEKIYNGYFTSGEVFEYVRHSGPKAWLGLAVLSYTQHTGNRKYLEIARHIAGFLHQMQDKEGGLIGGPGLTWYSTEHNLDAYAFFRGLYNLTGETSYREKSLQVKNWIARYAYTDRQIPIKRGKGDSTIATDTYAWSVTSFGPATLYSLGMDPEIILEFAAQKCRVSVNFKHQDGRQVEVTGFDFAKARNIGRGGVVSGEWTAQMILAYMIMADYFKDIDQQKQDKYLQKARFYFNQLQKMVIISPSRVGRSEPSLPYASTPFADTGHGWRTPRGNRTGSLASTAYFLIAYKGYNPLRLEYLQLSLANQYKVAAR